METRPVIFFVIPIIVYKSQFHETIIYQVGWHQQMVMGKLLEIDEWLLQHLYNAFM
jgi:hypothetical protein